MKERENSAASESQPQTQTTKKVERPKSAAETESALRKLAASLTSEAEEVADGDTVEETGQGQKPKPKVKPKNIQEAAERLGLDVSELYDMEIPSSREGEEAFTLGKLKDHMVEREDFTVKSLAFEESKRDQEAQMLRSQNELQELINSLPQEAIKPEVREAARKKFGAFVQQEKQRTLLAIPEWKDEKVRENDITDMAKHLETYGFPLNFLLGVHDHRLMKYFQATTKREQQLKAALAKLTPVKTTTPPRSQSTNRQATAPAKTQMTSRHDRQVQRMLDEFNRR